MTLAHSRRVLSYTWQPDAAAVRTEKRYHKRVSSPRRRRMERYPAPIVEGGTTISLVLSNTRYNVGHISGKIPSRPGMAICLPRR